MLKGIDSFSAFSAMFSGHANPSKANKLSTTIQTSVAALSSDLYHTLKRIFFFLVSFCQLQLAEGYDTVCIFTKYEKRLNNYSPFNNKLQYNHMYVWFDVYLLSNCDVVFLEPKPVAKCTIVGRMYQEQIFMRYWYIS